MMSPVSEAIPSSATSHNVRYVEGVDHLRGFAAFLVVFHHAYWVALAILEPPMLGVDGWWPRFMNPLMAPLVESHIALCVFFVLSGFILTLAGHGRQISYLSYMRNRCLRVLPVYFTFLFFGIALYPTKFNLLKLIASATIFSNQVYGGINLHPITTAFWTVAVEFQFYLIFPFLVAILARQGARPLLFVIGLMIALRGMGHFMQGDIVTLNYWNLIPGRLDQFLVGMLAARIYLRWHDEPRATSLPPAGPALRLLLATLRQRSGLVMAAAVVLFFGWTWTINLTGGFPHQSYWKALTPTLEALVCTVLILGYLGFVTRLPRLLRRVAAFFGDMSLSTYLCHFTVIGIFLGDPQRLELFPTHILRIEGLGVYPTVLFNVATVLLMTVSLSVFFFYGVERPFMRLRGRYVSDPATAR
jgi:peptidoglycan/LPS O-acetylase OafA/YrhL